MHIARVVVRILLGLAFIAFGIVGFVANPPAMPGAAGDVQRILHDTHWLWFIAIAQLAIGVLLLIDRWVPFAIVVLAAFLYNSIAYHATTSPQALPMPIVIALLGLFVAWPYRRAFGTLFTAPPSG